MGFPYPLAETREGSARLLIPDVPRSKGPGTKGPWPFYNGTMAVSRDLSAIVLSRWRRSPASVLDGLAATGAWGIRMALEADLAHITLNDRSHLATDLIRENLRRNGVSAEVIQGDLLDRLDETRYDYVDIDPFGPPTPFLPAVLGAAEPGSGLSITATDTAVLCGTYPTACERRYGSRPMRGPQGSEIGLRILTGYCARLAAERGRSIRPVLAYAAEHFLRIHMRVEGKSTASRVRTVRRRSTGEFVTTRRSDRSTIGPLWLGPLGDRDFVRRLTPSSWTSVRSSRLLSVVQGECGLPPFFVTTDELAALGHGSQPRLDRFIDGLRSIGWKAERTHFHSRGVKTDASREDIVRIFRERMPTGPKDD